MGIFGGEFLGFKYGGITSMEMGIIRTMQDRYNYQLTPSIKDTTTEVPSYSGVYFWRSDYDRLNITIPIAFEAITEGQLAKIKRLLNSKKIHHLVFDEEPYKMYDCMVSNNSSIDYVCFEVGNKREYRGEGSLQFISYSPYTRSTARFAEELEAFKSAALIMETDANTDTAPTASVTLLGVAKNSYEVGVTSSIELLGQSVLPSNKEYGNFTGTGYSLYNHSVVDIPFQAYVSLENMSPAGKAIHIRRTNSPRKVLDIVIKSARAKDITSPNDKYVKIDSNDYTITGCDANYQPTGTIYNDCIRGGTFFNLKAGRNEIEVEIDGIHQPLSKVDYRYQYN